MRYRWIGTTVAGLLALAVAVGAEETTPVAAGDRVRLQGPGIPRSTGSVLESGPGLLLVRLDGRGEPVTVAPDSLERLEVARGKRSQVWEGLGAGFVLGATVGGLGVRRLTPYGLCWDETYDRCSSLLVHLAAGVAGALVGSLVGAAVRTDRWEPVRTGRVRVRLAPVKSGAALGVTVAF